MNRIVLNTCANGFIVVALVVRKIQATREKKPTQRICIHSRKKSVVFFVVAHFELRTSNERDSRASYSQKKFEHNGRKDAFSKQLIWR